MFPKLSLLQWALFAAFLFFFGFAVFALTRDYYLRHPPTPPSASPAPHALPDSAAALGGRMREALSDSESGIPAALVASDPVLLSQEADRLFSAQRFTEAVTLYRKALELSPDDAGVQNDLGLALHYAGNTAEGIAVLRAGADAAPEFQRIWLSLGFVAAQAGDTELARQALTKAQTLDPQNDIGAEATRLLELLSSGE
jgi:tetratricopeptide (TPR) repeat protein